MLSIAELDVASTTTKLHSAEKLRLAARLVEEVAYAQAGFQSQQKVAHLMLVAASLDKLSERPLDFADAPIWPALVKS